MAGQRQDYLLSQLEILRHLVARLLNRREPAGIEEALQLSFNLQEKIFPLPPAEFLRLGVDDQVAALRAHEAVEAGLEKCLTYAGLLQETARLYAFKGHEDLAAGARQLALHVALRVALDAAGPPAAAALVDDWRDGVAPEELHAPVRELLEEWVKRRT